MKLKYEIEIRDVDLNRLDTNLKDLRKQIDWALQDIFNCSGQYTTVKEISN